MSTRKPDQKAKLTKTLIDHHPLPEQGQTFLRDSELKGFGLRITAGGVRAFIVEKRVNGRVSRLTLGRYGELTCEQARKLATQELGKIAMGLDPVAEKRRARNQGVTLAEAYRDFLQARKGLKARTRYDYDRLFEVAFADWHGKRLGDISRALIVQRHQQLGQTRGEAYANLAMRFLRSLFNFALPTYDDGTGRPLLLDNPVAVLTQTRAWYRTERRQTMIKVHQLPAWFQAVETLRGRTGPGRNEAGHDMGEVIADYLLLLIFTGLRRQEAATLTWDDIDLKDRTLRIADPKNHEPLTLPLSDFLVALLERRAAQSPNRYVFPDREGRKHLVEPKRQIQRVVEAANVPFTLHDLRRTFITLAESLDIAPYAIKRLVNHKMRGDVTAGYIVSDVERLRGPMQQITDALLRYASPGQVIDLATAKREYAQK